MLTPAEIKKFIDEDKASMKKKLARIGQRYYEGEHDIKDMRMFYWNTDGILCEDTTRANSRISHPFFMVLADQLSSYLLSSKENPIRARENVDGLQDKLDTYFDDKFWAEIGELITGAYTKGFEYLYAYMGKHDRTEFQCADSLGVVEVRANDTDTNTEHVIWWYVDRVDVDGERIKRIQVWDAQQVQYFVQKDDGEIELDKSQQINPRPHAIFQEDGSEEITYEEYGVIPFFRLDNNKKQRSGLMPIKDLVDDFDLHACSLSNNLIDFDMPLHVVKGYQGDDLEKLQQNLKTRKIIGVDSEGGIEVHTVDIPYQAREAKLKLDKENIYVYGMGFDPTQVGDGNITNVVIRSRYTLLDLKACKMKTRLCALLDDVVELVLNEINSTEKTDFQLSDIEYVFDFEVMTNESENIQNAKVQAETQQIQVNTVLNVAMQIGEEAALQAICEIMELDFDELKGRMDQIQAQQTETAEAQATLESVVTVDEPTAEVGAKAIP